MVFDTEEVFARLVGNCFSSFALSRLGELEHAHGLMKHPVFEVSFTACEGGGMLDSCSAEKVFDDII